MDEHEWLTCVDPDRMLKFLGKKYSPRKLRLFAVACCRTVWHMLGDAGHRAVEGAESFAEGRGSRQDLYESGDAALTEERPFPVPSGYDSPASSVALWSPLKAAMETSAYAGGWTVGVKRRNQTEWDRRFAAARAQHCRLLREIVGNPFRLVGVPSAVLAWQSGTVIRMAQALYEEPRFSDLPILADALEDAGCNDARILSHCRDEQEHVRGCWVLDLLRSVD